MKVLSQQGTFIGIGVTQTNVDNATVVRLYNSAATTKTVNVLEYVYPYYDVIGSISIPAGQVIYVQKKSEQYLAGDNTINYTKIAYSPVMQYASWLEGGGGGGGGIDNTDTDLLLHIDPSNNSSYNGSGLTVTDLSSSSNDGNIESNVNFDSTEGGGSFEFDSSSSSEIIFTPITIDHTAATVEIWLKNTTTDANTVFMICNNTNGQTTSRVMMAHVPYSGIVYFDGGTGSSWRRINKTAPTDLTTKWYHWTFVLSTTDQKIYLNGVEWHSGTGSSGGVGTAGNAVWTKLNWANGFRGHVGAFRVWKKEFIASGTSKL